MARNYYTSGNDRWRLILDAYVSNYSAAENWTEITWWMGVTGNGYDRPQGNLSWNGSIGGVSMGSGSRYYVATSSEDGLAGWGTSRFYHNSSGQLGVQIYGYTNGDIGPSSTKYTAEGSFWVPGIPDFNHSANTPSYNNITRDASNLSHFTIGRNNTGNVSGYGGTTYILRRANNSSFSGSSDFGPGSGEYYDFDQYTGYYFTSFAAGVEGGWVQGVVHGPYYGRPYAPSINSVTKSTSVSGRIDLSWGTPSNSGTSGYGSIQYYHVYRNGSYIAQVAGNSFADTGLTRGTSHTYQVYALGSSYWSPVSATSSSVMAPGVPSAPGIPTVTSKVGRNLTLNSTRGSSDYGNAISEYRIQLSTDDGTTWKGWDNSTKTFTANNTYNILDSSGSFTYTLLAPALTYKWRVYAVNSIGTGDIATQASGIFVSAGGRRYRQPNESNPNTYQPTETAKRYGVEGAPPLSQTVKYWDLTNAKRFNGTTWTDLT